MKWKRRHNKQNNEEMDRMQDTALTQEVQDKMVVRNKKKHQRMIILLLLLVCVFLMLSFAWYYYQSRRIVNTDDREVMPPYCLYLVEPNGTDELQLTVGNLHPGETKQIVVGVSNKAPDGGNSTFNISRDSAFNYELELAYTKNLPVTYHVYELTKEETAVSDSNHITVEWPGTGETTVSQCFLKKLLTKNGSSDAITTANNSEMYGNNSVVNLGQYDVYDKTSGASFDLTTTVSGSSVQFDLDYYLIEIEWNENVAFADYLKETDLVYVLVTALQLEPKESE